MPIARTLLQQMAMSAYTGYTKLRIGPFSLVFSTPTLKFYRDAKVIVISIRGTQDATDVKADALAILGRLGDSQRYKVDLETVKEFQKKYPRSEFRYIGVGHSLGGAILDRFLRAKLITNGISYNPLPEPQELFNANPLHLRVYHKDDPIYRVVGSFFPNAEVKTTAEPMWKYYLRYALPFGLGDLFTMYDRHRIGVFRGGKKKQKEFSSRLEQMGIEPSDYLALVKKNAEEYGYDPESVSFAKNGIHKIEMMTPQGQRVRFGRANYNDFLIWSHLEELGEVPKGTAKAKQNRFVKSHLAMKGDWKDNEFSPNWLSIRLLW